MKRIVPKGGSKVGRKLEKNNSYCNFVEVIKADNEKDELNISKTYFEKIMDSIPGGLSVYKFVGNEVKTLYFSPKIAAMMGMTIEEYEKVIGLDHTINGVYAPDREIFVERERKAIENAGPLNINVRIVHKNGSLVWVNINATGMRQKDNSIICFSVIQPIEEYSDVYSDILDEVQEPIYILDYDTKEFLYVNKKAKDIFLLCNDFVNFDKYCEFCNTDKINNKDYSIIDEVKIENKTYQLKSKTAQLYSKKVIVTYMTDITENKVLKSRLNYAIEMMTCGCTKAKLDDLWTVIEANENFYNMIGYTQSEFEKIHKNGLLNIILKNQANQVKNHVKSKLAEEGVAKTEYCIMTKSGDIIYVIDQSALVEENGEQFVYTTFFDITDSKFAEVIKEARYQKELEYRNSMLESLLAYCVLDVSENEIIEYKSKFGENKDELECKTLVQVINNVTEKVCSDETIDYLKRQYNKDKLERNYSIGEKCFINEHYFKYTDGSGTWVSIQTNIKLNPKTKKLEAFIYLRDITDDKQLAMAAVKEIKREYDFIACIDAIHNNSIMLDSSSNEECNKIQCPDYNAEVLRYSSTLILPEDRELAIKRMSLSQVLKELEKKDVYEFIHREVVIAGIEKYKKIKYTYLDKDKKLLLFSQKDITEFMEKEQKDWISKFIKTEGKGNIKNLVSDCIKRQEDLRQEILQKVHYNNLTGLLNVNGFCIETKRLIEENKDKEFCILINDINNFKAFNELFGRTKGDELLKYIGSCFKDVISEKVGVCGYLGTDDFAACFAYTSDSDIEEIITNIEKKIKEFYVDYEFIISAGVYKVESEEMPVTAMSDRAELALNKAKEDSLQYCIYDDKMRSNLIKEQEIVNEFSTALKEQQFKMYLQPQYDIETGKIAGAEALARWVHPTKGVVPPGEFIPVLEKNGLIPQLDRYIANEACSVSALLRDTFSGAMPPSIAINLSRADIFSPEFTAGLDRIRENYNLPPSALRIEITESLYVEQPEFMSEFIDGLRNKGYRVEMDDFGSGYSSLNALKDMNIDLLKLDMNFLSAVNTEKGAKIVKSVVYMARELDIPVLAEGIEKKEQVDFLKNIGCKYAQGYYYARPMPVEDYINLLMSRIYDRIK